MAEQLFSYAGKKFLDKLFFGPNSTEPILKKYTAAQKIMNKNHVSGRCLKYNFEANEPTEKCAPKELIICGLKENDFNHMYSYSHLGLLNKYQTILQFVEENGYEFENADTLNAPPKDPKKEKPENQYLINNKIITLEVKKADNKPTTPRASL